MSIVGDGALAEAVDPTICITLLVSTSIGISGTCHLRRHDQMPSVLKWLYYISSIAAVIFQGTNILCAIFVHFEIIGIRQLNNVSNLAGYIGHLLMMLCILCTTVLRLNMTTTGTAYQLSKCALVTFTCVIVVCFNAAGIIIITMLIPMNSDSAYCIQYIALSFWFPLYILGAISAVVLLSRNLLDLAKMQAANSGKYERLVGATTRYLICFLVALTSSLTMYGFSYFVYPIFRDSNVVLYDTIRTVLFMCDQCLNFLCIYLQYAFGIKLYNLLCCIPDRCCRRIVERKIGHHVSLRDGHDLQLQTVRSFSPTSASQPQAIVSASSEDVEMEPISVHGNDEDLS